MTLKNGSVEEVRAILTLLWNKYNITLAQWAFETKQLGCPVSESTFHRLIAYGRVGELKLLAIRKFLECLKQRYPEELLEPASTLEQKPTGKTSIKQS